MPKLSVSIRVHDLHGEEYEVRGEWPLPDDTSLVEADWLSKELFGSVAVEMYRVEAAVNQGFKPCVFDRLAAMLRAITPQQRESYLLAAQRIATG